MNLIETYKLSLRALKAHKIRSFLTMLGVIIGVFAVSSLVSLGVGIQNYINQQFDELGSNLIFVVPGTVDFTRDPSESYSKNKLEQKHIDLINVYAADYISNITPNLRIAENVVYKNKNYLASVQGSNYLAPDIYNVELKEGRFFTRAEERAKAKVAIIGPLVAKELFPNQNPIGNKIRIGNGFYEVIGVAKEKGRDFDQQVEVPYTSLIETSGLRFYSAIVIKAKNTEEIELTMRQVELALLRDLKEDDFSIMSQEDILSSIQNILGVLTIGLGAIAGISLLVGGIGIMNIMLVSVTERIKEIGLRKAVGATSFNIALQFLFESVILSVLGGLIGLFFGWLTTVIVSPYFPAQIPFWGVILAFGFSVLVGVVFGTYPAIMASKKDPIEALRYE
jgi:putative ABC transport system permease protein